LAAEVNATFALMRFKLRFSADLQIFLSAEGCGCLAHRSVGGPGTCSPLLLGVDIKIVATRCHILSLKCTNFDSSWSSAQDTAGGAHSAPQTCLVL